VPATGLPLLGLWLFKYGASPVLAQAFGLGLIIAPPTVVAWYWIDCLISYVRARKTQASENVIPFPVSPWFPQASKVGGKFLTQYVVMPSLLIVVATELGWTLGWHPLAELHDSWIGVPTRIFLDSFVAFVRSCLAHGLYSLPFVLLVLIPTVRFVVSRFSPRRAVALGD
jgi:hypothetical protein